MKRKRIRKKRAVSVLMTMIMLLLFLSGCAGKDAAENVKQTDVDSDTNGADQTQTTDIQEDKASTENSDDTDGSAAMGRYIETVTDLSETISGYQNRLFSLEDGTLMITDLENGLLVSRDNGETWEIEKPEWYTRLQEEGISPTRMAIGADHTVAVIYSDYEEGEEYNQSLLVIRPDGTEIPVEIPMSGDKAYPQYAAVTDSGRIFVSVLGSDNIYEVKEDGGCEAFLMIQEGRPQLIQSQGNLLIMDGANYKAPLIYDFEAEEYIEDEVLETFVQEEYNGGNQFNTDDGYTMYFFTGEEGILYLAGSKGVHRHVIGGSAMEQVIDGRLSMLGNPSNTIQSMLMLPGNEFMALFQGGSLIHFVYDPDIPTVPSERLHIYSLEENSTIQQAVSLYQLANPETFVQYEIGLFEGSSVTREDALKSLNTKIMAGEGPDVLILDDMPIDSYIEKGLLLDLYPVLTGLNGDAELFRNIVEAMKTKDGVYAMPCEIQIPIIGGEEKYISQMKDLEGIADAIEALRRDNPEKKLFSIGTEKGIMRYFGMVCAPAWITSDGKVDKEAIAEFLEQTKRIYDANMENIPEKIKNSYVTANENWLQYFGESLDDSDYLRTSNSSMEYATGYIGLMTEALTGLNAYAEMLSVNKVKGFEETVWETMNGQSSNIFCARTLLGINAASEHSGQAEDFIRLCLSKENQSSLYQGNPYNGFPVNKAAFEDIFLAKPDYMEESGAYSWIGSSDEEGNRMDFVAYWPDEAQKDELRKQIEAAGTPYMENTVIEYTVYNEGVGYFQGRKSLEETVNAIERKIGILLAE